jgi:hypothetical protein
MRHLLAITLLLLAACEKPTVAGPAATHGGSNTTAPATTSPPPSNTAGATQEPDVGHRASAREVREHMREHWGLAVVIRDAVIAATLDELPDVAGELADHKAPDSLAKYREPIVTMRTAAETAQKTGNVKVAATATADLARACGDCHLAAKVAPSLPAEPLPPGEDATKAHMLRYDYAIRELWAGLVIPSDERWADGARALKQRPLKRGDFFEDWEVTDRLIELDQNVHRMRGDVVAAATRDDRVKLFGELIANCASCHAATAQGPVD